MSDEATITDWELDELSERLVEAASQITVPANRIKAVRARFVEEIDATANSERRRLKRAVVLVAAILALGAMTGTAYASSKADPGSTLWSLRTAGWNLRLAFTSEGEQAEKLAEQAEDALTLAEGAVHRCDTKGAEVARKEAILRVERAREKIESLSQDGNGNAAEVLARVEAKLAELPPPGGPVCDENGSALGTGSEVAVPNEEAGPPASSGSDGKAGPPASSGSDGNSGNSPSNGNGSKNPPKSQDSADRGNRPDIQPNAKGKEKAGSGADNPGPPPGKGKP